MKNINQKFAAKKQENIILKHLFDSPTHSITPVSALVNFGVYRLSSVINRLRKAGHEIHTEVKKTAGKKYAVYRLHKYNWADATMRFNNM
jgi:hypothetical protein